MTSHIPENPRWVTGHNLSDRSGGIPQGHQQNRAVRGPLILLRHGQSTSNANDEFTGWRDVPLTARGRAEAIRAAQLLAEHHLLPEVVHTSMLTRTIDTAQLLLGALGRSWVVSTRSWRLNERHYGALQGRDKAAVKAEVGHERFTRWRRSFAGMPPPLSRTDPSSATLDPRYAHVPPDALPDTESLETVTHRLLPYWYDAIAPNLLAGRNTLVVAHGNSLRALIMHLDGLTPDEVGKLNLPTGIPLRYDLDGAWRPVAPGGSYLDPAAAATGIAEVAAQGGT